MSGQRFGLSLRLDVYEAELAPNGTPYRAQSGHHLEVREELDLGVRGFMEIAGVLGRFHELGEAVRRGDQAAVPLGPFLPGLVGYPLHVTQDGRALCNWSGCHRPFFTADQPVAPWRVTTWQFLEAISAHRDTWHVNAEE